MSYEDARAQPPRSRPGQFAQLLSQRSQHLLRRPMSIHDEGDGWRSFMVKPIGPASRELVQLQPGEKLDVTPPLGRGFPSVESLGRTPLLLVGGGFGIAPLHFLARRLDALPEPPPYRILYGGRSHREVELEILQGIQGEVLTSTDDGTLGFHGTCVDLALQLLQSNESEAGSTIVLTCGSHAMMDALFQAVGEKVHEVYVSLEEVMACGVGVCMGCVTSTREGYVPICTHGPVFRAEDVLGPAVEVGRVQL